jgi:hypothetical protein
MGKWEMDDATLLASHRSGNHVAGLLREQRCWPTVAVDNNVAIAPYNNVSVHIVGW